MTPEEFSSRMARIFGIDEHASAGMFDTERAHGEADELMCQALRELGYSAGVRIFETIEKWYA